MNPDSIKEIDLKPYRVMPEDALPVFAPAAATPAASVAPGAPRSIRIDARGATESVRTIFTIGQHPLWIGRQGCHVELPDAELDLRHCSISLRGDQLVVRDSDSHTGTFLDGERVTETTIPDGVHVLRVGSAIVTVEPVDETGTAVEPIRADAPARRIEEAEVEAKAPPPRAHSMSDGARMVLVCIDGPLNGQEFEIPPNGLVVGREGHVRVPDEFLSRKHFEVVPDSDGSIRVRDLGSRNGTFLNTLPAQNAKVHSGDEIRAGTNRFRIEPRA